MEVVTQNRMFYGKYNMMYNNIVVQNIDYTVLQNFYRRLKNT